MNKRRTIYKGFNKRRKINIIKSTSIVIGIFLLGGGILIKVKDMNMLSKLSDKIINSIESINFKKPDKVEEIDYNDISKELEDVNKVKDEKEEASNEQNQTEVNEETKVAVIDGLNIHTIQVASVENDNDMPKIEAQLNENNIPFSIVEIDGFKKVHTYSSFKQDNVRDHLESVKKVFPDAFLSQMKVPVLSLEYTNKYLYVEGISSKLNDLIKNFEEESNFWDANKDNIDIKSYNKILTSRKNILDDIKNEANKIDYSNMEVFKDNLIKYTDETNNKVDLSLKSINEKNYNVSKSLFLSSMQGYFLFINSIKEV